MIVAGTLSASVELIGCVRLERGVSFAGVISDDVDQEREKLSAGSGNARSVAGSTSLRPRSGARPYFGWYELRRV